MAVHPNVLSPQGRMPVKQKKHAAVPNKGKGKENVPVTPWKEHNAWVEESQETPWEWKYLNDFSSSKVPPLFSKDGSYFFSLAGVSIKIFSVASGQVVSELILPSGEKASTQSSRFTAAVINPHNFFQLITSTLDGRLLIWDFLNATLLRQIDIGQPLHFLCVHEKFKDSVVAAASLVNKKAGGDTDAVVLRISLKTTATGKSSEVRAIGKTRFPSGLAFSFDGSWIVTSAGHTVYVAKSSALDAGFVKYVSPERLTCLAMHPSEDYFATGDEKGNVRIWYCLNSKAAGSKGVEQRSQTTSLHWHAHAVSALAFTPNGAYLLSGGEEAVLVIWQIHSGKKEFVPRVGSAISTISICNGPSSEEYLLGLNDGTFSFVSSSTFRLTRSFSQIKIDSDIVDAESSSSKPAALPLAFHPKSASIILPSSHPQSLQIYSPASSTLLSELEVSPSNRVSKRDDKPVEHSHVKHVALSSCGAWMATLDARNGEAGYPPEIFLKVWEWNEKLAEWTLHSRIDQPHGTSQVVSVSFSPQSAVNPLYLSSCSENGSLKIWRLKSKPRASVWSPHASLDFPTSHLRSLNWSSDGTIFSLTFESRVVLYDSSSVTILNTISCSSIKNAVSSHFIGSRYLLIAGKTSLLLWDLILQTSSWMHSSELAISYIVPHPAADTFAVFHEDASKDKPSTTVQVFGVGSACAQMTQTIPLILRTTVWFGSASADGRRTYNLVALTDNSKVVVLGNDPDVSQSKPSSMSLGFASQKPSLFQDIFGPPLEAGPSVIAEPSSQSGSRASDNSDAFPHPAYLTPSLSSMFTPIVKGFLRVREEPSGKAVQKEKDEDSDEEMEDDPTGVFPSSRTSTTQLAFPADQLIQFFKKQSASPHRTPARTNGVAKLTNGVHTQPGSANRKESGRTKKSSV